MSSTLASFQEESVLTQSRRYLYELYRADQRPWIIAFSGGKDSTLVLQLLIELLHELDSAEHKPVYVLTTDTRVESPNIAGYVEDTLARVAEHAKIRSLPLTTLLVKPEPEESFWGKLIGKGYPSPTRWFRWCTSNMKIKPARRAIEHITREHGSAILLLGTRLDESASRRNRMNNRTYNERRLNPHHEIPDTLVAIPVADWTTDEVWEYLFTHNPPPWGGSHDFMLELYRQAAGGECPVVLDLNTPSCGGSRFGCWTCTVVKQDKSMQGFIASGESWMRPLNEFRNWLKDIRENSDYRMQEKRDGREGPGPFTFEARKMILKELLELEHKVDRPLISDEELQYIQCTWNQDFDYADSALKMALSLGREVDMPNSFVPLDKEKHLIEELCEKHELQPEFIEEFLKLVYHTHPTLDAHGAKAYIERDISELINKAVDQARNADPSHDL